MEASESTASNRYILVINGKPEGPFTITQLQERNVRPGDFLKTNAMDDYKEAHEIAELRQLLGFSKEALIPQYFGSFDQRLMASALDWFLVTGVCIIAALIICLLIPDKAVRIVIFISLSVIIPLVKLIYNIVMECSPRQATYGKQILKIKVCDMQGFRITAARAAGRNLAKLLSVATLFIGYLFAFFNKQQQCLHDMVAGTLVMKDRLI